MQGAAVQHPLPGRYSTEHSFVILPIAPCPSNTGVKMRSSVACAGFVSCIRLFGSLSRSPHKTVHDRVDGLTMQEKPVP
jgi:hypothetical protein